MVVFHVGISEIRCCTSPITIFSSVSIVFVFERRTYSSHLSRLMTIQHKSGRSLSSPKDNSKCYLTSEEMICYGLNSFASARSRSSASLRAAIHGLLMFTFACTLPPDRRIVKWWSDWEGSDYTERSEHHLWSFQSTPQKTAVSCESFMMGLYLCFAWKMRMKQ